MENFNEKNEVTKIAELEDNQEKGASLVEYALLVALIAVVAIGAVTILGTSVSTKFSSVASAIG